MLPNNVIYLILIFESENQTIQYFLLKSDNIHSKKYIISNILNSIFHIE